LEISLPQEGETEKRDQQPSADNDGPTVTQDTSSQPQLEQPESLPSLEDVELEESLHSLEALPEIASALNVLPDVKSAALKSSEPSRSAERSPTIPALSQLMSSGPLDFLYYEAHGPAHALELTGYGWSNTQGRGRGKARGGKGKAKGKKKK